VDKNRTQKRKYELGKRKRRSMMRNEKERIYKGNEGMTERENSEL
jgi:hypothetical protein